MIKEEGLVVFTKECGIIFNRHKWDYSVDEYHRICLKCCRKEHFIAGIGAADWFGGEG